MLLSVAVASCSSGTATPIGALASSDKASDPRPSRDDRATDEAVPAIPVGLWSVGRGTTFLDIDESGDVRFTDRPGDKHYDTGTWTLSNGRLTLETGNDDDNRGCGQALGTYDATSAAGGDAIMLDLVEDTCTLRAAALPLGLTRVLSRTEPVRGAGLPRDSIVGTWIARAQGYLVTYRQDGTWDVREDFEMGPFDGGSWSLEGSVLTMGTEQGNGCPIGSVGQYEIELVDDGRSVEASLIEDSCQDRVAGTTPRMRRLGS
jgi:hypothetical protein